MLSRDELGFDEFRLSSQTVKSLRKMGYEAPFAIQVAAIPPLMEGRDLIAQAKTGSGKTAAFGILIVEKTNPQDRRVQALIVCPTRELTVQVREEISQIGKGRDIQVVAIYGGQQIEVQVKRLEEGPHVVVGTPGRLMDMRDRKKLDLSAVSFVVVDEADRMLDMGFRPDIDNILRRLPGERQTMLFSATIPDEVVGLAARYMRDPVRLQAETEESVAEVEQHFMRVLGPNKVASLCYLFENAIHRQLTVVFCRTKRGAHKLAATLEKRGYRADALHGDLTQAQRDRAMARFRAGKVDILIATDVAARGLDIDNLTHVINYDVPEDVDSYIHRIGRTGRAGKTGVAYTLVAPEEVDVLRSIEARLEPESALPAPSSRRTYAPRRRRRSRVRA